MGALNWRGPPLRNAGSDPQNEMLGGSHNSNSPNLARDQRLMSLDFLGEVGDAFVTLGAAICAAASAENIVVLELALRQARSTLLEGIAEFKSLPSEDGGAL